MNQTLHSPDVRTRHESGTSIVSATRPDPDRETRLAAARRRRKSGRTKPFLFVLITLGAWWLLSVLADVVITCVPGGAPCRVPYLISRISSPQAIFTANDQLSSSAPLAQLTRYEWPLLLLALFAALWVARAMVYPASDDAGEFTEDELDGNR